MRGSSTEEDMFDALPGVLAEVAEVAGLKAALELAAARGGNRAYIPAGCGDDHWLVRAVGREAADAICAHFAVPSGIEIEIPRGPTGRQAQLYRDLARMIGESRSSSEITRALGISRRTVTRHRAKLRAGDQLCLFEED